MLLALDASSEENGRVGARINRARPALIKVQWMGRLEDTRRYSNIY